MKRRGIDRRGILRVGAVGLGAGLIGGRTRAGTSFLLDGATDDPRCLVLVQLSGGNDGLSTVIPHGDDAYHRARRSTRLEAGQVLPIDDYRGFHPRLEALHSMYGGGHVAIVEGAGYPQPNRSHFKSMDIWHAADPRGRNAGEGWVGRMCRARFGEDVDPNRVVHVGARLPYSLHSTAHPAVAFSSPEAYRWMRHEDRMAEGEMVEEAPATESNLDFLRRVQADAHASSESVRRAAATYEPRADYPDDRFGGSLATAAALIRGRIGTRIVSVELTGFDTHNDQSTRYPNLMRDLDRGLAAFRADLDGTEAGRNTLIVAFSEFGRRVRENGSGGTDHGTAGPMFVIGDAVRGGLHGAHPSLENLDDGDLIHTTDFRSVYATVVERWFDTDPQRVLGGRFGRLELLA